MMNLFGAYYKVDPVRPKVLLGKEYENAWDMGGGVSFFLIDKDALPDQPDGKHAMSFDVAAISADQLAQSPIIGSLLMGYPIDFLLPTLLPSVRYLIETDIAEGCDGEEIVNRRIAILVPEFVGFTHEEVKLSKLYSESTDEYGITTGNISRCSLEG
jgi:hypothetical protein